MQLFKSEPLVEGRHYAALLCDKTLGTYQAVHPPGKSYLSFCKIGDTFYVPSDFFDWWTSDTKKIPDLEARYAEEWAKVEEELAKRRKSRT